jgi:hypothetical protein
VIEMSGGSSSLYDATGGSITLSGKNAEGSLGFGAIGSKFVGGATFGMKFDEVSLRAGREVIPFNLPTDIFNSYHVVYGMGTSLERKSKDTDLFVFGGSTSKVYMTPYFEGMNALTPVVIFRGRESPGKGVEGQLQVMVSTTTTTIASLSVQPNKQVEFAFSGGLGDGKPYGAASLELNSRRVDLKAAYIEAGSGFRRLDDDTLQAPEPNKANVLLTLRPWRSLTLSGGHQSYAMPVNCVATETNGASVTTPCDSSASSVDELSADYTVAGLGLGAAAYRSQYNGYRNDARVYSARRRFGRWLSWTSSYLESIPEQGQRSTNVVSMAEESPTARLTLNETWNVSRSGGNSQQTVGIGGGWMSNVATFHADYETYYVASRPDNPFEQALILDVQMNLGRGVMVHSETLVAPDGRLLYTTDARSLSAHEGKGNPRQQDVGNARLKGRVVDTKGVPVEGAALRINQMEVYTGSDGTFEVRERRRQVHAFAVLGDRFLDGKAYRVVSAPVSIRSTGEEEDGTVTVVVAADGAGL